MSENPFRAIRQATGLSVGAFAAAAELNPATVKAIEAGYYPAISLRQNHALGKAAYEAGVDVSHYLAADGNLAAAYLRWQREQRAGVAKDWISPEALFSDVHSPMAALIEVEAYGQLKTFCTKLRIPPATVARYVRGTTHHMPGSLRTALIDAGYLYLTQLESAQSKWRIGIEIN